MTDMRDIENKLKELGHAIGTDETTQEKVMTFVTTRHHLCKRWKSSLIWRTIMNRPMIKLSAAAIIALAAVVAIHYGESSSVAWGEVLDKIRGIDTYVFRIRQIETTGPRPDGFEFATEKETTVYRSEDFGAMDETYWNGELFQRYYRSLQKGECARICYPLESYERWSLNESLLQTLQEKHPQQIIVKVLEGRYTQLGRDKIGAIDVEGVQTRAPGVFIDPTGYYDSDLVIDDFVARVWFDIETQMPVWVEFCFTPHGSTLSKTIVMDQFQWAAALDFNVFDFTIPADFRLLDQANPDSTPKTEPQVAFVENTRNEPYLADFDHLDRPDLSDLVLLDVNLNLSPDPTRFVDINEIWQAQDQCMAQWPAFDQVRDRLTQELQEKLNIQTLSVEALVVTGISLRERFWMLNGCLSEVSYPYAYASRIVLEIAHQKAPLRTEVTDQLVESIMTYSVLWPYPPDPNRWARNPLYTELVTELRSQQFSRIKQDAVQGRMPTWKDLVRTCDLAVILGYSARFEEALEVTAWLKKQQDNAGWTDYEGRFATLQRCFTEKRKYACRLFNEADDAYPEAYRYSRRLSSFQGPGARRSGLRPRHLRHLEGK